MIVVTGLLVSSLIFARSGWSPSGNLGVDDDDAGAGHEDRGVAAAALEHEEVVLELLHLDDARRGRLLKGAGNGR